MLDRQQILNIAKMATQDKGYVVYADFDDYLRKVICNKEWPASKAGWILYPLKQVLLENGYRYSKVGREGRFYLTS